MATAAAEPAPAALLRRTVSAMRLHANLSKGKQTPGPKFLLFVKIKLGNAKPLAGRCTNYPDSNKTVSNTDGAKEDMKPRGKCY